MRTRLKKRLAHRARKTKSSAHPDLFIGREHRAGERT
jgi:hypothetical protein